MLTTKDMKGEGPQPTKTAKDPIDDGPIGDFKGAPETHVAEMEHSPLGPSSSDRWINCTASVKYTEGMPDTSSTYANEGTAAHMLSEWCRERNVPAKNFHGHQIDVKNSDGSVESFIVDNEMVEGVQRFLDYVNQFDSEVDLFEVRVNYSAWVEKGFGTSDDTRICAPVIRVTDLKFGKGKMVYAKNNTQLMLYALGIFQDYGYLYEMEKFILTVHQPRLDHVDEWEITCEELIEWANTVAQPKSIEALHGDATFAAGDWCQFCPGKNACATRAAWVGEMDFDPLSETGSKDVNTLTNEEVAELLERKSAAVSFWSDLESYALSQLQQGKEVGEFKLVEGRSNRKWRDAEAAETALRKAKYKVSEIFTRKLITAPAAEKLLGKKHPIMAEQVVKPQGKPVMVPGSDKRAPYQAKAEEEFEVIDND